ncbi:response regulator [Yeosuana sp.]|uniref:response regulator n=1 Tax=Yeosuana sp. TaxID=2529388 RepID=UPI004055299B|tara:strand:+ start:6111 stop:7181 length:1071 start_codon:yes stop_codon:yes gene_type:complete
MEKILLIEDNEDVRENTTALLELANYRVVAAENGKIGVEMAKKNKLDLIICDIMMPELDGYGVLQTLSKHYKTASIPFIFLTAKTEKDDIRKGMNLGADDYLTKPFSEQELLEAVKSRLKKHSFLKKQFSQNVQGITEFLEDVSEYLDLESISRDYSLQNYKKNDLIFMEGDTANSLCFVQSGIIKTYKTSEAGKDLVTGLFGQGSFIGQLSLLTDHGLYLESAMALEDVEIYKIPKIDFLTLLYGNKVVSKKFINLISNNLIEVQKQLLNIAFATVRQKVARALLELQQKGILTDNKTDGISISREDFAGIIGTAPETAIRMLTEFKEEGLITIGSGRKIIIQNEKALKEITTLS